MKRQKLMAWLLSLAMVTSLTTPVYADDFDDVTFIEEDSFSEEFEDDFEDDFEEEFEEEHTFEDEADKKTEKDKSDKDEDLLEEETEAAEFYAGEGSDEILIEGDMESNEELFAEYVDREFGVQLFSDGFSTGKGLGYRKLSGDALTIYTELRSVLASIADGEVSSTRISITLDELDTVFTMDELGIEEYIEDDPASEKALEDALYERYAIVEVLDYLRADCPYELYWFDKTVGVASGYGYMNYPGVKIDIKNLVLSFTPEEEFSDGDYRVNMDKTGAAKTAASNAMAVADQGAGLGDYEKLTYFKDQICELTSYNEYAVSESYPYSYGNPWQLIWVFDNDPSTEVVCEGYSKAFQYLYELSEFKKDIESYIITGYMDGGTGAGAHMWNIVRMENGKNYMVDVTNCDDDTVGYPDKLFLAGTEGNVGSGYRFDIDSLNYSEYTYDSNTLRMYTTEELTLDSKDYVPGKEDPIEAFVTRLYQVCLDRTPDAAGLAYWTAPLREHRKCGLDVARGFVFSKEFQSKNMSDEQFLTYMYQAFFGRTPDAAGMSYWLNKMATGTSRDDVFYGFADSVEFDRICTSYGIVKKFDDTVIPATSVKLNLSQKSIKNGATLQLTATVTPTKATNKKVTWTSSKPGVATVSAQGVVTAKCPGTTVITCTTADGTKKQATCTITVLPKDGIEEFVLRMYETCLSRTPDAAGLGYWADRLRNKTATGRSAAHGFIFSKELTNKKLNDEQFVEVMYKAFFGRTADAAGKEHWMNKLKNGSTREQVFNSFVVSKEFTNLCAKCGIARD